MKLLQKQVRLLQEDKNNEITAGAGEIAAGTMKLL
jgi:hypothetical protein